MPGSENGEHSVSPSAPSQDEINRITTLSDILQLGEDALPEEYAQSLELVHQHTADDIQSVLSSVPLTVLSVMHGVLADRVCSAHQEFQGRRVIKRTLVKTAVSDIINLGLCLVSKEANRELDKIFLEKTRVVNATPADDIYSKYVEMMELLSTYEKRLETVEAELRNMKRQSVSHVNETDASTSSSNITPPINNQLVVTSNGGAAETERQVSNTTANSENAPISDNVSPVRNKSAASVIPNNPPSQNCSNSSKKPQPRVSVNGATTDVDAPPQNPRINGGSRVKAARCRQVGSEPNAEIYVGGTAATVTCEDIRHDLLGLGVEVNIGDIRMLSDKADWRSFVVKVPKSKEQLICNHPNWSKDLRVRPFRARGAGKSQTTNRGQVRRPGQQLSKQKRHQPNRTWARKQQQRMPECECQTSTTHWSPHRQHTQEQWPVWRQDEYEDDTYLYRDWYESEFPALGESWNRRYRY